MACSSGGARFHYSALSIENRNINSQMEGESHKITLKEKRELNKMNLDTFTMHYENWFESSANETFRKLHDEIIKGEKDQIEWERIKKEESYRYKELSEQADRAEIHLETQINESGLDNYYRNEELWAIMEMKIIYLYKSFEINIKQLFKGAYPKVPTKRFFRWDSIVQFLNEKDIDIKEISGYKELIELKNLNNSFKHSDTIEEKITANTKEFKSSQIDYIELENWYCRIRNFPMLFLKDLSHKIYEELYAFDDKKITAIHDDIALRMEEEDVLSLIKKLKKAYNIR